MILLVNPKKTKPKCIWIFDFFLVGVHMNLDYEIKCNIYFSILILIFTYQRRWDWKRENVDLNFKSLKGKKNVIKSYYLDKRLQIFSNNINIIKY